MLAFVANPSQVLQFMYIPIHLLGDQEHPDISMLPYGLMPRMVKITLTQQCCQVGCHWIMSISRVYGILAKRGERNRKRNFICTCRIISTLKRLRKGIALKIILVLFSLLKKKPCEYKSSNNRFLISMKVLNKSSVFEIHGFHCL